MSLPDGRAHGDLGGDVAGHALTDGAQPFLDELLGVLDTRRALGRGHPDVGGHAQDLFEALALVEALGEAEPGAGDGGQALAPRSN